ncbi:zinc finger C2HC domain-containing protein 1C-like [Orbicella faveolata]|uniref:zinc finger C2HC domain-containing protein 1C-like n=1 Tax=Orbicella faveolata TaxID=48498 RepID=UPI0009E51884|nr:zinc finger C2HC domain-containing protein 1C-like [Orbicella faveolata]
MAQILYDSSPTRSLHQYNSNAAISSHVPDTMKSVSANISQANYNMNHNRSAPKKKKLSRLELLRNDYSKKLQLEREEKINKLRVVQQENSLKPGSNGGGMVREFFAERRAMEATRKGQKNPELLPPIESHFKKVKEQKQDTFSQGIVKSEQLSKTHMPAGRRISLKQEPLSPQKPLSSKYSTRIQTRHIGVNVRKRTKGIDKQDPLPPVSKRGSDVTRRKPPTPNKRYETHSILAQDDGEDFETSGPFMPVPPIESKPNTKRSKAPLPSPSAEESVSDYDDALSTLTDYSSVPPNLSKLKAKALRQRQLSKQKLITTNQQDNVDNGKLTDFQTWQMEQDRERTERLEKHKQKSELSLSQRENEILNKIQEEQLRLDKLKQQRKELEEQEKQQKEEHEKWLAEKHSLEEHAILPQQHDPAEDSKQIKRTVSKKVPKPTKQPVKKETPPPTQTLEDELDQSENIHDNAYNNFYDEATKDVNEVLLAVSPCSICGRNFAPDRLAKHEKVCAKTANTKRKVFDTRKHRSVGTEHEKYVESGKYLEEPKKRPKADWRTQHENFVKAIRYAKGVSNEPPPPTENPDYVQCPHCERKFNPATAERHIPKCKDIKAKPARLKKKR